MNQRRLFRLKNPKHLSLGGGLASEKSLRQGISHKRSGSFGVLTGTPINSKNSFGKLQKFRNANSI